MKSVTLIQLSLFGRNRWMAKIMSGFKLIVLSTNVLPAAVSNGGRAGRTVFRPGSDIYIFDT